MSIESLGKMLCGILNYSYAEFFPRGRDALSAWCKVTGKKIKIPTNCCPALLPFASELVPVNPNTGLAPVPVQLYGYRQEFERDEEIEIDPLMTGALGTPFAWSTVVSFGYGKTIDIGGGGAILTCDRALAKEIHEFRFFPRILESPLMDALCGLHSIIMEKKKQYEEIEKDYAEIVIRLPDRPIIPWRFVAKKRDEPTLDYKFQSYKFGFNYPPLPGVTDPGAIEWGKRVINIWR